MNENPAGPNKVDDDDDDDGPIGIFPSWNAVYVSVVVFTILMIAVLAYFTVAFNHSVS